MLPARLRRKMRRFRRSSLGDLPNSQRQTISATITAPGQLKTVDQFNNIVLRANTDGSVVRLQDVARIELGSQSYATSARLNGKPAVGLGIQLTSDGNALASSQAVKGEIGAVRAVFPSGRALQGAVRQFDLCRHFD